MTNKYQEALDFLSEYSLGCAITKHKEESIITINKYKQILQELVDEKTPMKPIRKGKLNWWHCPKCDCSLMFDNHKYCDHCSQKLKWGDSDE